MSISELNRRAMLRLPLTYNTVESFYDGTRSGSAVECLRALCESHERLRMESDGAQLVLDDKLAEITAQAEQIERLTRERDTLIENYDRGFVVACDNGEWCGTYYLKRGDPMAMTAPWKCFATKVEAVRFAAGLEGEE